MTLSNRAMRVLTSHPFETTPTNFDALVHRLFNGGDTSVLTSYAVDVREDADHLYVDAELPGFTKEEVDITLEDSLLTIAAEHKPQSKEAAPGEYLLSERRFSRYLRSFKLPPTVDEQSVQANLVDGVLKVTLNKREESKPRKIKVT